MTGVDLNADVGEADRPAAGDEALLASVTSASVACGFHAGNAHVMRHTVEVAARLGVTVGAHPSYADRDGFGRRDVDVEPARLVDDVLYQIGALEALARAAGTAVRYVKPHGALYHRMHSDPAIARAVAEAVRAAGDLVLLAAAGSPAIDVAERLGVTVATEAFADRAYLPGGTLVPRGTVGAVLDDPAAAAAQAVSLACEGRVRAIDGSWVQVRASSLCVHGDTPAAATLAAAVRAALAEAGVDVVPFVT